MEYGAYASHFPHFNSRPSARGDAYKSIKALDGRVISIHAPPRGATDRRNPQAAQEVFQFTPLREGRRIDAESCIVARRFQFTPLREGRQFSASRPTRGTYFNSRPSARGDFDCVRRRGKPQHFNSRPSARGDPSSRAPCRRLLFQFTPLREGRPNAVGGISYYVIFQFTPLREGRRA